MHQYIAISILKYCKRPHWKCMTMHVFYNQLPIPVLTSFALVYYWCIILNSIEKRQKMTKVDKRNNFVANYQIVYYFWVECFVTLPDPKSGASANSATRAWELCNSKKITYHGRTLFANVIRPLDNSPAPYYIGKIYVSFTALRGMPDAN